MFKRIVALALNPSLDTTLWIDQLNLSDENMAKEERTDASGKAVNLARTFKYYDVPSSLVLLLGKYNKHDFVAQLNRENIQYRDIEVEGNTRENLSIVQRDRSVTRVIRRGFAVPYEAMEEVMEALDQCVDSDTLVMISGALPDGISPRSLRNICSRIHSLGGQITLDSRSITLQDICDIKPWAIKPNRQEFCNLFEQAPETLEDVVEEAKKIVEQGISYCLISLGEDGILCVSKEGVHLASAPSVEVCSTVGAGDSALAGFVKSMMAGKGIVTGLKTAVAFGTAACMVDGTQPPHKLTVCNLLSQVQVQEIPV